MIGHVNREDVLGAVVGGQVGHARDGGRDEAEQKQLGCLCCPLHPEISKG
jgi:hypothetical protein